MNVFHSPEYIANQKSAFGRVSSQYLSQNERVNYTESSQQSECDEWCMEDIALHTKRSDHDTIL